MKILILGGFSGAEAILSDFLGKSGSEITIISEKEPESAGVKTYIKGNPGDDVLLFGLLKSDPYETIVDFTDYKTEAFTARVNMLLSNCRHYIFMSSGRVFADSDSPLTENSPRLLDVTEDTDFLRTDSYALAKARQEDVLRASGKKNYTIIRPYVTCSENRYPLGPLNKELWLYRALHGRTIVFPKDLLNKETTLCTERDLAIFIAFKIITASPEGEARNVPGDTRITWKNLLSLYLDTLEIALGFRPEVHTDITISEMIRIGGERYELLYDKLWDRSFIPGSTEEPDIPYQNLLNTVHLSLNEFVKNPVFFENDWKMQGCFDRLTGEKTPLAEINGIRNKLIYTLARNTKHYLKF